MRITHLPFLPQSGFSGKLPQMKGNYHWREPQGSIFQVHDYGRKGNWTRDCWILFLYQSPRQSTMDWTGTVSSTSPCLRWFLLARLQKNLAAHYLATRMVFDWWRGNPLKWLEEKYSGQWRWPIWECRLLVGHLHDLHLNYKCQLHDLYK